MASYRSAEENRQTALLVNVLWGFLKVFQWEPRLKPSKTTLGQFKIYGEFAAAIQTLRLFKQTTERLEGNARFLKIKKEF